MTPCKWNHMQQYLPVLQDESYIRSKADAQYTYTEQPLPDIEVMTFIW